MRSRSQTQSSGWRPGDSEWCGEPDQAVQHLEQHVCLLEDKVRRPASSRLYTQVAAQVLDGERLMHTALELAKRFSTSVLDVQQAVYMYFWLQPNQ